MNGFPTATGNELRRGAVFQLGVPADGVSPAADKKSRDYIDAAPLTITVCVGPLVALPNHLSMALSGMHSRLY